MGWTTFLKKMMGLAKPNEPMLTRAQPKRSIYTFSLGTFVKIQSIPVFIKLRLFFQSLNIIVYGFQAVNIKCY